MRTAFSTDLIALYGRRAPVVGLGLERLVGVHSERERMTSSVRPGRSLARGAQELSIAVKRSGSLLTRGLEPRSNGWIARARDVRGGIKEGDDALQELHRFLFECRDVHKRVVGGAHGDVWVVHFLR
jgi:hypothetical protein